MHVCHLAHGVGDRIGRETVCGQRKRWEEQQQLSHDVVIRAKMSLASAIVVFCRLPTVNPTPPHSREGARARACVHPTVRRLPPLRCVAGWVLLHPPPHTHTLRTHTPTIPKPRVAQACIARQAGRPVPLHLQTPRLHPSWTCRPSPPVRLYRFVPQQLYRSQSPGNWNSLRYSVMPGSCASLCRRSATISMLMMLGVR